MSSSRVKECQNCGKKYDFCMSCGDYHQNFWSYRMVACSPECFQELEKKRLCIVDEVIEEVAEIIVEETIEKVVGTIKRK